MANEIVITVNGRTHHVAASPDTPLLYVLRNELGLNGPQFGCGLEQCGVCMVLLGAKAVQSCKLAVSETTGAAITTLEGLMAGQELHPLQRAFLEEQAAQCGFCTNGMIIAAAALLAKNRHPTDQQIREALEGNLCRCGAHVRVLRAVKRAADLLAEEWGESHD
ncbi:MAG: (2Fe-2S)-binding protein [Anaerolineales bacterium]|jgi:nicotinate dehydrogenase subunit A